MNHNGSFITIAVVIVALDTVVHCNGCYYENIKNLSAGLLNDCRNQNLREITVRRKK